MSQHVYALFETQDDAAAVVQELQAHGFARDQVSVIAHDKQQAAAVGGQFVGAETGAAGGGLLGGALGLLVGLGALAIPGIGPLVAAGPLATALMGAGVGVASGGVIGTLVSNGIEKHDADVYAEGVRRGGTLVSVAADAGNIDAVRTIFARHNAVDANDRREAFTREGWTAFDSAAGPYQRPDGATPLPPRVQDGLTTPTIAPVSTSTVHAESGQLPHAESGQLPHAESGQLPHASQHVPELHAILTAELQDLYSAETQLLTALPQMADAANDAELRRGFALHLQETQQQVARLEAICNALDINPRGRTCKAMQGLIAEGNDAITGQHAPFARDIALIGAAQRVEHYEIAAYTFTHTLATWIGEKRATGELRVSLDEERATSTKLGGLLSSLLSTTVNR